MENIFNSDEIIYTDKYGIEYSLNQIIATCKENLQYAKLLLNRLEWQSPETLIQEDIRDNEIFEFNGQYILTGGNKIEINVLN